MAFIVSDSIKMYKGLQKTGKKKADPWKPLLGALIHQKSCGYYVMRYMKDTVEDNNLDLDENWGTRLVIRLLTQPMNLMKSERNGLSMCYHIQTTELGHHTLPASFCFCLCDRETMSVSASITMMETWSSAHSISQMGLTIAKIWTNFW